MQHLKITDTPIRGYLFAFVLDNLRRRIFTSVKRTVKITLHDTKIHAASQLLTISNYAKCNFSESILPAINSYGNVFWRIVSCVKKKKNPLFQSN